MMNEWDPEAVRRGGGKMAYPFFACMMKQALLVAGTVCVFGGGIVVGHFATTGWPGPRHWMGAEMPIDAAVMGKLKRELGLTPGQTERIGPVIAAACANLRMVSEEKRAERLALMDEIGATIAPDLSAEQQRKLAAMEGALQNRTPVKRDMRIVALF